MSPPSFLWPNNILSCKSQMSLPFFSPFLRSLPRLLYDWDRFSVPLQSIFSFQKSPVSPIAERTFSVFSTEGVIRHIFSLFHQAPLLFSISANNLDEFFSLPPGPAWAGSYRPFSSRDPSTVSILTSAHLDLVPPSRGLVFFLSFTLLLPRASDAARVSFLPSCPAPFPSRSPEPLLPPLPFLGLRRSTLFLSGKIDRSFGLTAFPGEGQGLFLFFLHTCKCFPRHSMYLTLFGGEADFLFLPR